MGAHRLYRVPATGGAATLFTQRKAYRAAVSGHCVIFNVAGPSGVELWSKPVEGGEEEALKDMPRLKYSDSWVASREGIYYIDSMSVPTVRLYDFASHRSRAVRQMQVMITEP